MTALEEALAAPSMVHQVEVWARLQPDTIALKGRVGDRWMSLTWSEYWTAIREVAKGLVALGHQPGECVAIVGANRMEWVICQLGIMAARGIPAPGYPTNTVEQVAHILRNSGSRIAIADTRALVDQYRAAMATDSDHIGVEHLVTMLEDEDPDAMGLAALRALGREADDTELDARLAAIAPDEVCLLIYTSGTTGVSKGVMLDHGGILTMQTDLLAHNPGFEDRAAHPWRIVSYLPLCHVAEQVMTNFVSIVLGGEIWFCPDLGEVKDYLLEARPTVFAAVPRVWEKFQGALEARFGEATGMKSRMLAWARATEAAAHRTEAQTGQPVGGLRRKIADRLVLSKVREALGLDQLQICTTGAAPISRGTLEFFASIGIVVHEYYGMSETTGLMTGNPAGAARFGTVGRPLRSVELKIAEDGEIVAKGRAMTRGYLRMPEKTAELIDEEGWLHTGDLGELDSDGYLKITGRKKDILITAGGKNVAPAEMEGYLNQIPGVGLAVVVGDRKPYLSALVVLDPENLETLARNAGVAPGPLEMLARDSGVLEHLMKRVESDCNAKVARYQTVKRITVLPNEFSVDGGELTPTMKVKRNVVSKKYADQIESMYSR